MTVNDSSTAFRVHVTPLVMCVLNSVAGDLSSVNVMFAVSHYAHADINSTTRIVSIFLIIASKYHL